MIPMQAIEGSSHVASAGFDAAQGVIRVGFHNGRTYDYPATQEHYDGLLGAESKGAYYNAVIKPLGGQLVDPADEGDEE